MKFSNCRIPRFLRAFFLLASSLLAAAGLAAPSPAVLDETHAAVRAVMAVEGEVTGSLMQSAGILGTAVGADDAGTPALVVFVDKEAGNMAEVVRSLPAHIRGTGVKVELTERFRAYTRPVLGGGTGTSNTAIQSAPIKLGTSGGWRNDLANGYCCGGTLGSLVQANGVQYIMSNYHVMESDIVSGGNGIVATTGSFAIQPGLIDVGCNASSAQNVGTLYKVSSLPGSNVDVGVAQVIPGMVSADG